jgi:hypothetical protein
MKRQSFFCRLSGREGVFHAVIALPLTELRVGGSIAAAEAAHRLSLGCVEDYDRMQVTAVGAYITASVTNALRG